MTRHRKARLLLIQFAVLLLVAAFTIVATRPEVTFAKCRTGCSSGPIIVVADDDFGGP